MKYQLAIMEELDEGKKLNLPFFSVLFRIIGKSTFLTNYDKKNSNCWSPWLFRYRIM